MVFNLFFQLHEPSENIQDHLRTLSGPKAHKVFPETELKLKAAFS